LFYFIQELNNINNKQLHKPKSYLIPTFLLNKRAMAKIVVNDKCTNCAKCVKYCPMNILYMDEQRRLKTQNEASCIECLSCEIVCPYDAITIFPAYNKEQNVAVLPH